MLPIIDIQDVGGAVNVNLASPPIAVNIIRVPADALSLVTSAGDSTETCDAGEYLEIVVDRTGPGPDFPAVARLVTIASQ